MSDILGHSRHIEYLEKILQTKRIAHAYLFSGPGEVGKKTIAETFARAIIFGNQTLCLEAEPLNGGSIIFLGPEQGIAEAKGEHKEISIADIRELKRRLSYAPRGTEWRVILIDSLDHMTPEAATAFLKLLEEPGEQTIFLLVSAHPDALLPTIRSRTQEIRFSHVPEKIIREFLEKNHPDRKKEHDDLLALAGGRPGALIDFLCDRELFHKEQKKFQEIQILLARGFLPDIFQFTERISQKENFEVEWKQYFFRIVRDAFLQNARTGVYANMHPGKLKEIDRIFTLLEETNVNPRLALDVLLLQGQSIHEITNRK